MHDGYDRASNPWLTLPVAQQTIPQTALISMHNQLNQIDEDEPTLHVDSQHSTLTMNMMTYGAEHFSGSGDG
jgi:hypothetical protein